MAAKKLLILPGDGIGVEVMAQVRRIIDWMGRKRKIEFEISEGLLGGAAYDVHGTPYPAETLEKALAADAVLLGAVGGPKWDDLPFDKKPERGLLGIRKDMGLFANLRPALVFDALAEASTLKHDVVAGLDIMILRELTARHRDAARRHPQGLQHPGLHHAGDSAHRPRRLRAGA
jgi:3-isopropylmalate dehydrogenase